MFKKSIIVAEPLEGRKNVIVVYLEGQMDESNLIDLKNTMEKKVFGGDAEYCILNLKDLQFLNSRVIGYLASLYSISIEKKVHLMLTSAQEGVHDVLVLVGLTKLIPHFLSMEEALENIDSHQK